MRCFRRFPVFLVALGLLPAGAIAFQKEKWSSSCQRAVTSINPCDLTDTYIKFACNRAAENNPNASDARSEVERIIRSACSSELTRTDRPYRPGPSNNSRQSECFITTACADLCGLPDDCFELRLLREFRDQYMLTDSRLTPLVDQYYTLAPSVLSTIQKTPRFNKIMANAYAFYIFPAAILRFIGMNKQCLMRYLRGMEYLQRNAAEI